MISLGPRTRNVKVILGTNVNLDYVMDAMEFLNALNVTSNTDVTLNRDEENISSKEELSNVFAHFFQTSSAAERIVMDDDLWKLMVRTAEKLNHEKMVGGNAALMAIQLAKSGVSNVVVAGMKIY